MKRLASSGLLLLAAIGCGGKDNSATTAQVPSGASTTTTTSPATAATPAVVSNGATTEPGEIVALFLDSLRRGDEKAANGVLTAQAQASLLKTDFTIDPLGTPDGKYTIGRVGFVDGDATTGLVECVWTEPNPEAGKPPVEMEIVCEVHKEPQGWRISGMAVKMAGTDDTFVLDFEDPQSLQAALGGGNQNQAANVAQTPAPTQLGGSVTSDLGVSGTVGLPTQPTGQPVAMPGQPAFPQQPTGTVPAQFPSADQQQPTQIAFPPNPNVNR